MNVWKWIGLAGVAGVTAFGVARGTQALQRRRREFVDADVETIRAALRARHADAIART